MEIVKVVKRYGLCGGMEEYAYRLSHELHERGASVTVLTERELTKPKDPAVKIVRVQASPIKPRWLSHLLFSRKISEWIKRNPSEERIVHSHERIACHDITTIHSTLFNFPRKGLPGLRKYMNEYLERRELLAPSIRKVVPVSGIIERQIKTKHPETSSIVSLPIAPGVSEIKAKLKSFDPQKPIIGFIGKEWRRKGLPKVIAVWRKLRKHIPRAKLCLAGFSPSEPIGLSSEEKRCVHILGWIENKSDFFGQIDILLHPARIEAYGMVIAEAMSLGIPVACSNECGASKDVSSNHGKTLDYDSTDSEWVHCVASVLGAGRPEVPFKRSWKDVCLDYCKIYQELKPSPS